jgi:hypothetical protein
MFEKNTVPSESDSLTFDIDVADYLFNPDDIAFDEQNFAITGAFMLANNPKELA